jgi:ATP-dependent RNA helicase RhlE
MLSFEDFKLTTPLINVLKDLGYVKPTAIQIAAFNVLCAGKDVVGIAQTGTGKTLAYSLPIIRNLKYSSDETPRVLIMVPTRELVVQVVNSLEALNLYTNNRVLGVYGGTNINTQKNQISKGIDILVATPGRLYDLALSRVLKLKNIQKLVIDEVDVMLDLGFRHQLINIFDLLPSRRQNIMFSATMTSDVDALITDFFINPERISVALSGTPLKNIMQFRYEVPNYYTKLNLVRLLTSDHEVYYRVLIFVSNKRMADRLFLSLSECFQDECCVIHSNKTQNYRLRSIEQFRSGVNRILVATDVMARGLDIDDVSHVINFDTPEYPENYMHRIGRTGRAKRKGISLLFSKENEMDYKNAIEELMKIKIDKLEIPNEVEISKELIEEERTQIKEHYNPHKKTDLDKPGPAFHEKSEKNQKENLGGSYKRIIAKKYKKPKTRGDKNYNRRKKK